MTTREAIETIAQELADELVIGTTGYTCRDLQAFRDRPANFYMIGSMGVAAAIGLGIACVNPAKKVVVFDGDGSVLMGLGVLPMVSELDPANLIHLVFDNGAFVSTGGQPTCSRKVPLEALALAAGYAQVHRVETQAQLVPVWRQVRQTKGPVFLLVKCLPDVGKPMERVLLEPEEIRSRFMEAVRA